MADGTSLTPAQKFEEQMKDRIRQSIGDLMPDEMLKATIEKVLNEAFFKFKEVNDGPHYGSPVRQVPPPLYTYIESLLKPMVEEYARNWFVANPEVVNKLIQETMGDQMLMSVVAAFQRLTSDVFVVTTNTILDKLRELDRKTGGSGSISINHY